MKFHRSKIRPAVQAKVRTGGGRTWRTPGWVFAVVLILTATGRALLPWAIRDYVNRTLDRNFLCSGQGGSEDESKESKPSNGQPAQAEGKQTLYERLGGEKGLVAIVEDFAPRAMQDPRVNWDREGVKRGTLFHRAPKQTWTPTTANIATM